MQSFNHFLKQITGYQVTMVLKFHLKHLKILECPLQLFKLMMKMFGFQFKNMQGDTQLVKIILESVQMKKFEEENQEHFNACCLPLSNQNLETKLVTLVLNLVLQSIVFSNVSNIYPSGFARQIIVGRAMTLLCVAMQKGRKRHSDISQPRVFLKNIYLLFFYYFWLHWVFVAARAFSSCSEQGLLFVVVQGPLIVVASLVVEHRLQAHGLQQLWLAGSRAQTQQL